MNRQGGYERITQKITDWANANAILIFFVLVKVMLHLVTSNNYGYFIDELYTIACGNHLAFGYVDIPPLVPLLSRLSGLVFGYSLIAVHILPALAGGATVLMGGLIARRLGGGMFAQALAAGLVTFGTMWFVFDSFFGYDCFDQLVMAIFFFVILDLLKQERPRLSQWLVFGLVAGLGLMTKGSMLFYGLAFLIGLVCTSRRRYFTMPGLWLAGAVAILIFTPYLIWQGVHNWPVLEYWGIYGRLRTYHANPLEFLLMQMITTNPLTVPVWVIGFIFYFKKGARQYRAIGFMIVFLFLLCVALQTKFYMFTAAFIPLFAGGAVLFEKITATGKTRWVRPLSLPIILLGAIFLLPLGLPLLPVDSLAKYVENISFIFNTVKTDNRKTVELPQYFADRFGWENMVRMIAEVYKALPQSDQQECVIMTDRYGQAGAVDLLGQAYGLPPASSGHLSYFFWGPPEKSGRTALAIGIPMERLAEYYGNVETRGVIHSDHAMWSNNDLPVLFCSQPKFLFLRDIWPNVKHFD
jgi:hypothetical protein